MGATGSTHGTASTVSHVSPAGQAPDGGGWLRRALKRLTGLGPTAWITGSHYEKHFPPGLIDDLGRRAYDRETQKPSVRARPNSMQASGECSAQVLHAELPEGVARDGWAISHHERPHFAGAPAAIFGNRVIGIGTELESFGGGWEGRAWVMAHEMVHGTAGHINARASQQLAAVLGSDALARDAGAQMATASTAAQAQRRVRSAVGPVTAQALSDEERAEAGILTRRTELEADAGGLMLVADAGIDPRGSIALLQGIADRTDATPAEVRADPHATHPHPLDRIAVLQALMPEAQRRYEARLAEGPVPDCSDDAVKTRALLEGAAARRDEKGYLRLGADALPLHGDAAPGRRPDPARAPSATMAGRWRHQTITGDARGRLAAEPAPRVPGVGPVRGDSPPAGSGPARRLEARASDGNATGVGARWRTSSVREVAPRTSEGPGLLRDEGAGRER